MARKFYSLVAMTSLVALAAAGCHHNTCGGKLQAVGGVCQKGVCQKSVCQKGCGGCDGGYRGGHLLSGIHSYFWGCSGCGEVYWNEWQYDPPDCCDPCDDCYGCYVGPRDCCKHKFLIDPVLWVKAIKGTHCRQGGCYDPCGNWHCGCEGDCGCGCGKCGSCKGCGGDAGFYGDEYLEGPGPDAFGSGGNIDEIPNPDPIPVNAARGQRVASSPTTGATRQASHELRR